VKPHLFLENLKSRRVAHSLGVLALGLELLNLREHVVALVDEVEEEMGLKPVLEGVFLETGVLVEAAEKQTDAAAGSHGLLRGRVLHCEQLLETAHRDLLGIAIHLLLHRQQLSSKGLLVQLFRFYRF